METVKLRVSRETAEIVRILENWGITLETVLTRLVGRIENPLGTNDEDYIEVPVWVWGALLGTSAITGKSLDEVIREILATPPSRTTELILPKRHVESEPVNPVEPLKNKPEKPVETVIDKTSEPNRYKRGKKNEDVYDAGIDLDSIITFEDINDTNKAVSEKKTMTGTDTTNSSAPVIGHSDEKKVVKVSASPYMRVYNETRVKNRKGVKWPRNAQFKEFLGFLASDTSLVDRDKIAERLELAGGEKRYTVSMNRESYEFFEKLAQGLDTDVGSVVGAFLLSIDTDTLIEKVKAFSKIKK